MELTPVPRRQYSHSRVGANNAELFGHTIPAEVLSGNACEVVNAGLGRVRQRKYSKPSRNISRASSSTEFFLPELMQPATPKAKVLEMYTAYGTVLEVLRHSGHDVTGNDLPNMLVEKDDPASSMLRPINHTDTDRKTDDYGLAINVGDPTEFKWLYKNIIGSFRFPMRIFDAGKTPYPCTENEFDVTICPQAVEHYCHPDDWMIVLDELCRITKETIAILLCSPSHASQMTKDGSVGSFNRAGQKLKQYNANGFRCLRRSIRRRHALGFKLVAVK